MKPWFNFLKVDGTRTCQSPLKSPMFLWSIPLILLSIIKLAHAASIPFDKQTIPTTQPPKNTITYLIQNNALKLVTIFMQPAEVDGRPFIFAKSSIKNEKDKQALCFFGTLIPDPSGPEQSRFFLGQYKREDSEHEKPKDESATGTGEDLGLSQCLAVLKKTRPDRYKIIPITTPPSISAYTVTNHVMNPRLKYYGRIINKFSSVQPLALRLYVQCFNEVLVQNEISLKGDEYMEIVAKLIKLVKGKDFCDQIVPASRKDAGKRVSDALEMIMNSEPEVFEHFSEHFGNGLERIGLKTSEAFFERELLRLLNIHKKGTYKGNDLHVVFEKNGKRFEVTIPRMQDDEDSLGVVGGTTTESSVKYTPNPRKTKPLRLPNPPISSSSKTESNQSYMSSRASSVPSDTPQRENTILPKILPIPTLHSKEPEIPLLTPNALLVKRCSDTSITDIVSTSKDSASSSSMSSSLSPTLSTLSSTLPHVLVAKRTHPEHWRRSDDPFKFEHIGDLGRRAPRRSMLSVENYLRMYRPTTTKHFTTLRYLKLLLDKDVATRLISARVSGALVRYLVKIGQDVEEHTPVAEIVSLKMHVIIIAAQSGCVVNLLQEEEDIVSEDTPLIELA